MKPFPHITTFSLVFVCALAMSLASCATPHHHATTLRAYPEKGIMLFKASIGEQNSLTMFIDTGVDPSVIDEALARKAGLTIDDSSVGEAIGSGDGEGLEVRRAIFEGLSLDGRRIAPFEALAADLSAFGDALQTDLAAILGYSFMHNRVVRIDYRTNTIDIADTHTQLPGLWRPTTEQVEIPFRFNSSDDPIPVFEMKFNGATFDASLDTGKSGGVEFYAPLVDRFNLSARLGESNERTALGARGTRSLTSGRVSGLSIGSIDLGNSRVTIGDRKLEGGVREANAGNATFEGLVVTIDYPRRQLLIER